MQKRNALSFINNFVEREIFLICTCFFIIEKLRAILCRDVNFKSLGVTQTIRHTKRDIARSKLIVVVINYIYIIYVSEAAQSNNTLENRFPLLHALPYNITEQE